MDPQNNAGAKPAPQTQETAVATAPPQTEKTFATRFTDLVVNEFKSMNPRAELTEFQKRLSMNYFFKVDQTLKELEKKRLAKSGQYQEQLAYTWQNINLPKLAQEVVAFTAVGLDPLQPNHISMIPYKNNATGKYDVGGIIGFRGCELKAKKYALEIPEDVVVELVYATDKFTPVKKDINNPQDAYYFEITDAFNRGDIVGGFYYIIHADPKKNVLKFFNKAEIDKRKPAYASVEFWGGEKDNWEWDKDQKKNVKKGTVHVEGWYAEMAYKTIFRAAYNSLTIDSSKIDEAYRAMASIDADLKEEKVQKEINENANRSEIGFTEAEVVPNNLDRSTGELLAATPNSDPAPAQTAMGNKPPEQPAAAAPPATNETTAPVQEKLPW